MTKIKFFLFLIAVVSCGQSAPNQGTSHRSTSDKSSPSLDLVGIWQAERYDEADAWPDAYQFFSDGKFIFNFSQYDGAKRILRINGTYSVANDTVLLNIKSTVEAIGGYLTRSTITTLSDSWELEDYSVQTIKQINKEAEAIRIRKCDASYPKECLIFGGRKYFRMDKDPAKYN